MKRITVLGAGMVGGVMAIDLSKDHDVTLVDYSQNVLDQYKSHNLNLIQSDLSKKNNIAEVIKNADLVIGAVPGFMGYETVKTVIENKKDIVDISFFDENAFELDDLAKENNVTAIVDCGVAPGMSNLILGRYNKIEKVSNFVCYVGGLPIKRDWPFEYKAPFSPSDVIEEYTRPARYVMNSEIVTFPALSDAEIISFNEVGSLEAFNTDGLRSLIFTMSNIPNMKEKTLRYPGHIDYMRMLRESGFFLHKKVNIRGQEVSPLDLTSHLLFKSWKLEIGEREFTIMRIIVDGETRHIYDLYDEFDPLTGFSSMSRTTGFTCTAAANMFLEGLYSRKGISPPEYIGENEAAFNFIMEYLKNRNVIYKYTNIEL